MSNGSQAAYFCFSLRAFIIQKLLPVPPPYHFVYGPFERRHSNMPLHYRLNIRALARRVNQITIFIDRASVETIPEITAPARIGAFFKPRMLRSRLPCLTTRICGLSFTSICGKLTLMSVSFGQSLSNSSINDGACFSAISKRGVHSPGCR